MAIINSYPTVTPTESDLVLISDVSEDGNPTRTATVSSLGLISQGGGLIGPQGEPGAQGVAGLQGAQGAQGNTGSTGLTGSQGTTGLEGPPGQVGGQGVAGADGTSISILGTVANCAALPPTGNTIGDLYILDAADGGCPGGAGVAGDGFVWTAGNVWLNIGPIRGPQGIQGVVGNTGSQGQQGQQGPLGPAGQTGDIGSQGVQGIQGEAGSAGPIGPQGPPGSLGPGTKNSIPLWTTTTTLGDSFLQQTEGLPDNRTVSTKGFELQSQLFDRTTPTPSQGTDKQVLTGGATTKWKNLEDIGAVVNTTDVGFTPPTVVSYIVSLSQGEYNGLVSNPPITFANTLYVII